MVYKLLMCFGDISVVFIDFSDCPIDFFGVHRFLDGLRLRMQGGLFMQISDYKHVYIYIIDKMRGAWRISTASKAQTFFPHCHNL